MHFESFPYHANRHWPLVSAEIVYSIPLYVLQVRYNREPKGVQLPYVERGGGAGKRRVAQYGE